jgi:GWxTD domain-containing protein
MIGSHRTGCRLAAAFPLVVWLAAACQSTGGRGPVAAELAAGPTRWLMLPEEEKAIRRLRTSRDEIGFVEEFWRRRDPDLARTFQERVEAADRLYSEDDERGSLTDRGRALILLGPPPVLRYSQRRVPSWDPGRAGDVSPSIGTRSLALETWVYPRADLSRRLLTLLDAKEDLQELALVFVVEPGHTHLSEGEKYLQLAARAAVRDEPAER